MNSQFNKTEMVVLNHVKLSVELEMIKESSLPIKFSHFEQEDNSYRRTLIWFIPDGTLTISPETRKALETYVRETFKASITYSIPNEEYQRTEGNSDKYHISRIAVSLPSDWNDVKAIRLAGRKLITEIKHLKEALKNLESTIKSLELAKDDSWNFTLFINDIKGNLVTITNLISDKLNNLIKLEKLITIYGVGIGLPNNDAFAMTTQNFREFISKIESELEL